MKIILVSLLLASNAFAGYPYKFHYGDQVIVKKCDKHQFMNVCGKVGIITGVSSYDATIGTPKNDYAVKFTIPGVDTRTEYFFEENLEGE